MTALEFRGVVKDYHGLRPLRVGDLAVAMKERVALAGLDVQAAEAFVNLATGALLPDQGEVGVMGRPTSAITEADAWLASLDIFGIVSHRAVLLEPLTVAQNVAMSFSLSVEPVPPEIESKVAALADRVEISGSELATPAGAASGATRMRTHLARALALNPSLLLMEHPTLHVERADVPRLAASIVRATAGREIAVLALTDDEAFAKGLGGGRLRLDPATGDTRKDGSYLFRWRNR
jgi:ABC-type lipoprotein export system ATPase subunit